MHKKRAGVLIFMGRCCYISLIYFISASYVYGYNDPFVKYNKNIHKHLEKDFRLVEAKLDLDSNGIIDDIENYIYDSKGYLITVGSTEYNYDETGNLVTLKSGSDGLHNYEYANGYLIKDVHDFNADGQFIEVSTYTYTNNTIIINHNYLADPTFAWSEKYTYNTNNLAIRKESDVSVTTYTYDSYGNMISQYISSSFGSVKRNFTYNVQNKLVLMTEDNNNNGSIDATEIYSYDAQMNLIKLTKSGLYGDTTYYYKWEASKKLGWLVAVISIILD